MKHTSITIPLPIYSPFNNHFSLSHMCKALLAGSYQLSAMEKMRLYLPFHECLVLRKRATKVLLPPSYTPLCSSSPIFLTGTAAGALRDVRQLPSCSFCRRVATKPGRTTVRFQ